MALTKHRVVMNLNYTTRFCACFAPPVDTNDPPNVEQVDMALGDWGDIGKPDKITVTIEPGDRLNDSL